MLKDRTTILPEEAAEIFLHGVSMEEFIIAGNSNIMIVQSLKGLYHISYCLLVAPIALLMKKYSNSKVAMVMKQY